MIHTTALESKPPTEIIQLIDGEYVKRAPTQEELARMPVLRMVTGYTCDHCNGTNCTDTHQRTDKQGKHQCYQCKDCGHKMSYPDN